MKKYKTIIFDLDGTLINTSEGIINCYNYTAQLFNKPIIEKERFVGIIGCPLLVGFMDNYNMTKEEAEDAVKKYRKRYEEKGIYEASVYEGIPELLASLKEKGYKLAVATLKLEKFANIILEYNDILKYFDIVYGPTEKTEYKKVDLLNKTLKHFNCDKNECILIGDSSYDALGAQEAGIDFLGVSYGLGYKNIEEIKNSYYTSFSDKVSDIIKIIEK